MALSPGTRLGPYEILSPLGSGGMGEVYRARDERLKRDVAVKVLPSSLAGDSERVARFEKEARSASALNHPNIVTIHDIGSTSGLSWIAMELVSGETLRALLANGSLPIRALLPIAIQLAEGLAKAHGAGIVHRDLKPENVMVTGDGIVKILDFGLAKLTQRESEPDATEAPTVSGGTKPGLVMGTAGYMSPEQALGRLVDFRSDQFALGSIVYEMATGRRAFSRASTPETLSAIIRDEPDSLGSLAPLLPGPLRWIVERCLAKEPRQRYASTEDLARDLTSIRDHLSELSTPGRPAPAKIRRPRVLAWAGVAGTVALAAALGVAAGRRSAVSPTPTFSPVTFHRGSILSARFAPDGESVVYSAAWDGKPPMLFLKRRDSPDEVPISLPSADILAISRTGEMAIAAGCRWTGVGVCSGTLSRATITAGAARTVMENVQQADWAPDGDRLAVVRDVGGRSRLEFPIGTVLYETAGHLSDPRFSPRGDLIAFFDHPFKVDDRGSVAVMDLAGHKRALTKEWAGAEGLAWSPRGDEIWFTAAAAGTSLALRAVSLSGRERLVAEYLEPIRIHDVSRSGTLLITQDLRRVSTSGRRAGEPRERDLSWLDWSIARDISPDGRTLLFAETGAAAGAGYAVCVRGMDGSPIVRLGEGAALALSPDGKWALTQTVGKESESPLVLLATGSEGRRVLPTGGTHAEEGEWLDDRRIVFAGAAPGRPMRLYVQDVERGDPRSVSPEGIEASYVDRIAPSPDGRVVAAVGPAHTCMLYSIDGETPRPVPGAVENEFPVRWSGDGRWLYIRGSRALEPPARLYRIELATGRREAWKELMPADPTGVDLFGVLALAPDGESYAYAYGTSASRLFLATGLR
jgi:Tol biopolymer transport system component